MSTIRAMLRPMPPEFFEAVEHVATLGSDLRCFCAPGRGTIAPDGYAVCDECGAVMVASTLAELIDREGRRRLVEEPAPSSRCTYGEPGHCDGKGNQCPIGWYAGGGQGPICRVSRDKPAPSTSTASTSPPALPGHWSAAPGMGSTAGRYAGAYRVDGLSVAVSAGIGLDAAPVWRVAVDERRGDIARHLGDLPGGLTVREAVAEADRLYPPPSWIALA